MDSQWEDLTQRYRWGDFLFQQGEVVGRASEGAVLGIGVFYTGIEARPLLLGNARLRPVEATMGEGEPILHPIGAIDQETRSALFLENGPGELLVMFVEPPEPLGVSGVSISSQIEGITSETRERGTLGPLIDLDGPGSVYMTAGHLLGNIGSRVDLVTKNRLGITHNSYLGDVIFRKDPEERGDPGYDVGLIQPTRQVSNRAARVAELGQERIAPYPATILGARSGRGNGLIQGALKVHSDGKLRNWVNSWMMMPGFIGAEGDSGASVIGPGGEVIGMQVGGSRVVGARHFAALFVHDLQALMEDLF
jgi:hypothetical protein